MAKKTTFNNPDSQEREYTRLLLKYSKQLQADVNRVLMPRIDDIILQFKVETRADSWADTLDALVAELGALALGHTGAVFAKLPGLFTAISKFNEGQFKMVVKANTGLPLPPVMPGAPSSAILGVNVFRSEPFLKPLAEGWISENTSLIKSLPTRLYPELEGIIRRGVMNGQSVKDIKDQIKSRYGVTDYRAKLIAQDQTLKLNADLTRYRLQSVGVERYVWRSVQDNRVRPEHASLNGREFSFAEPPAEGNPGQPVRCRCRAEAIWDEKEEIAAPVEPKKAEPKAAETWKPAMSKTAADKWAANSVVKEDLVHYTSGTNAANIAKTGFNLKDFGSGAGDVFARGVYTVPDASRATKNFYAREIGGVPIKLRANIRKLHEVTLDNISMGKAVSGGKMVTEFSKMNVDQVKAAVLHGIPNAASKLEKALKASLKPGFGGMFPDIDEAISKVLKAEGFDAVRIKNPVFNEGIGGDQLIILDPKRVTVVK